MSSQYMVTEDLIKSMIKNVSYARIGDTTTVCHIVLTNGFSVQGDSACVDPANFNKELGEQYAYEKAFNEIWKFAGFLMKQRLHEANERLNTISRLCHEVNRAYCEAYGDYSLTKWELAPEDIKDSARIGVKARLEQDLTPEEQHALWCRTKLAQGWKYGEQKDPQAKTHPCLVPYTMLPVEQRAKDYLFCAIVSTFKE